MRIFFKFLIIFFSLGLATCITIAAEVDGVDGKTVRSQERTKDGKVIQSKETADGKVAQNKSSSENKVQQKKETAQNTSKNKTQSHNPEHDGKDHEHGDHGGDHHGHNNKYEFHHHPTININIAGHPGSVGHRVFLINRAVGHYRVEQAPNHLRLKD